MNIKALAFTKPANNIKKDIVGIADDVQTIVTPAETIVNL